MKNRLTTCKTSVLFVAFLCSLASCGLEDHWPVLFSIKNNSNRRLYFQYKLTYPDTSVDNSIYLPNNSTRTPSEIISAGQTQAVLGGFEEKQPALGKLFAQIPSGKLEVFVFDVNVVSKTPWDTVVAKYLVLKRYDLTLDSMKKMNRVITYP
jgi:hypothetical protein